MALITLSDLYDKWKKVSDWVTGVDTVSSAKVQLTGSNIPDNQAIPTKITTIERKLAFSTTTPLGASAVYTSPTIDASNYKASFYRAFSDVGGGVVIQHSDDGVIWDSESSITITAGSTMVQTRNVYLKYVRFVYTNGAAPQTTFRFSSYLSPL